MGKDVQLEPAVTVSKSARAQNVHKIEIKAV